MIILIPQDKCFTIHGNIILFHQEYDPRQLWLPFINVVYPCYKKEEKPILVSKQLVQRMTDKPLINSRHQLYVYEKNIPQMVLPFIEAKSIGEIEWKILSQNNFPSWERLDGLISQLSISRHNASPCRNEINDWLMDHCHGRFYLILNKVRFELIRDYAMAKLKYS